MKLLIAALALSAPAAPLPASAAVAPALAPASDLEKLVLLMMPDQQIIDMTMVAAGKGLDDVHGADFSRYPGMRDYVVAKIKPEMTGAVGAGLPALRASMAGVLSRELTAQEISELYAFFASPTGRKLYAAMIEAAGESAGESEQVVQKKMMDKLMARLTPDDYGPLASFGTSSAGAKMKQVMPQVTDVVTDWVNKLEVEHGPSIRATAAQAVADYKRQHPAGGQ